MEIVLSSATKPIIEINRNKFVVFISIPQISAKANNKLTFICSFHSINIGPDRTDADKKKRNWKVYLHKASSNILPLRFSIAFALWKRTHLNAMPSNRLEPSVKNWADRIGGEPQKKKI